MLGTLQCVEQKCIYQLYLCDGEVPCDPLMDIFNSLLGFAVVEVSLGNLPLDLSLLLARVRVVSLPQAGNEAWTANTLLPHLELEGVVVQYVQYVRAHILTLFSPSLSSLPPEAWSCC